MATLSRPHNTAGPWGPWQRTGLVDKKVKHVIRVTDDTNRRAVLKLPRNTNEVTLARFREEARRMNALTQAGETGVLPVLEMDNAAEPGWFVMPPARMLTDVLRDQAVEVTPSSHAVDTPNLHNVVRAIQEIASTLARLAELGIAHRDIKPPNLFWLDGRPQVGDFGIAAWPKRPELTMTGENVGPMYFIAPEMRSRRKASRDFPADVWSLAKTLFVLARGLRYPPEGTHYVEGPEFSLWHEGGNAGIRLEHILQAATSYLPYDRLTMGEFRDELRAWLTQHPERSIRSETYRHGFEVFGTLFERSRRHSDALRRLLPGAARQLAQVLHGDADQWEAPEGDRSRRDGVELLGEEQYGFPDNSPDGLEPDDTWFLNTTPDASGRRVVVAGLLLGSDIILLAEVQQLRNGTAVLEQGWRRDGRILLPSSTAARDEVTALATAWLTR
ncbi:protein kinase [Streptomyces sp. NPDC058961]|uniref:protein kinase domain-containing protein n=1 Tax=Streptomyces sp. NPDC058961 TaxID=3346680 RepID=UPI003687083D